MVTVPGMLMLPVIAPVVLPRTAKSPPVMAPLTLRKPPLASRLAGPAALLMAIGPESVLDPLVLAVRADPAAVPMSATALVMVILPVSARPDPAVPLLP